MRIIVRFFWRRPISFCCYFIHCVYNPLSMFKIIKISQLCELQLKSMNICLFSIKLPILVKIGPTVIEILTLINGLQKFTVSRSSWRRPRRWATGGGVIQIWPWDHQCCSYSVASSSACVCECGRRTFWTLFMTINEWPITLLHWRSECSPCCHGNLFWACNWKHVIKYDLYVKFPWSFAHNV